MNYPDKATAKRKLRSCYMFIAPPPVPQEKHNEVQQSSMQCKCASHSKAAKRNVTTQRRSKAATQNSGLSQWHFRPTWPSVLPAAFPCVL